MDPYIERYARSQMGKQPGGSDSAETDWGAPKGEEISDIESVPEPLLTAQSRRGIEAAGTPHGRVGGQ